MKKIMVSGGFDPVHIGHIRMIKDASRWGAVIVAINSDDWLMRKKGYVFMPWKQRAEIIGNIKGVTFVTNVDDSDGTVCNAIKRHKPDAFANGGDRKKNNTPEMELCSELEIQMLWSVGGSTKPQSSSWLINKAMEQLNGTTK
jgi:cytidyltransferase-like protein|tara:strand:- start:1189 stop:1617 length:429 start_codon:yes stop_codon:yes gene_type:complete